MISIIGAGPVGSYLGWLLAKKGREVEIFEQHSEIGVPVQCAGFLTSEIEKLIKADRRWLINRTKAVRVIAPDKSSVKFGKDEIVINRTNFDRFLADKAADAGAQLSMNHRFVGFDGKNIKILDMGTNKKKKIKSEFVIGADGPRSAVAKQAGFYGKRQLLVGMQARVKLECRPDTYEAHLGNCFPCSFAWVIPESESVARIGLISRMSDGNYFKQFLRNRLGTGWKNKVIQYQGGLIPVYRPGIKTQKDNIYLVGDAACQIKNTTAGGIVPGMVAAKSLCDSILHNKNYEREWRTKLKKELWVHYRLRKVLNKFSDKDFNNLVKICGSERVRGVIGRESREFPSKLILKLILNEPKLLGFAKLLFKA